MAERELLENAEDNLCFGCGPENPMGLRMRFYREGDRVTTELTPTKWWSGQPGVVNPGILYAVLIDLNTWAASGVLHRVPVLGKTTLLDLGAVSTHQPFRGVAWVAKHSGHDLLLRAEIHQEARHCATMEQEAKLVSKEEYHRLRPMVEIPDSLDGYFEP